MSAASDDRKGVYARAPGDDWHLRDDEGSFVVCVHDRLTVGETDAGLLTFDDGMAQRPWFRLLARDDGLRVEAAAPDVVLMLDEGSPRTCLKVNETVALQLPAHRLVIGRGRAIGRSRSTGAQPEHQITVLSDASGSLPAGNPQESAGGEPSSTSEQPDVVAAIDELRMELGLRGPTEEISVPGYDETRIMEPAPPRERQPHTAPAPRREPPRRARPVEAYRRSRRSSWSVRLSAAVYLAVAAVVAWQLLADRDYPTPAPGPTVPSEPAPVEAGTAELPVLPAAEPEEVSPAPAPARPIDDSVAVAKAPKEPQAVPDAVPVMPAGVPPTPTAEASEIPEPDRAPSVPTKSNLDLASLEQLELARAHIASGDITFPPGDNAVALIRAVLSKYPGNPQALMSLKECSDHLLSTAERLHASGLDYEARNALEELLSFDPGNARAESLRMRWIRADA